ncbi:MAG TPA: DUF4265 domain-containing protein [Candidatus Acidoferrum sp.]|nr:DUF4265 domain-containing protein [Candidatus Acidoferrum sp.]
MTDEIEAFRDPLGEVWRERANFIISTELPPSDSSKQFEQLWSRQMDDEFEVCCISFFVYDLALGDVFRTAPKDQRRYVVDHVVTIVRAGHLSVVAREVVSTAR